MHKIMIIGSGGSGKSTLAKEISDILKLPLYHLDALNWKPGWVPTPEDEWDNLQKELVKQDQWIIDGDYGRTMDIRISEADTIIFFDLARWIPVYRIIKRRIMYHGKTRPDLNEGCPERISLEFIKWVWNFKKDKRPGIIKKLKKISDQKNIYVIRNNSDVRKLMKSLKSKKTFVSNFNEGDNIL